MNILYVIILSLASLIAMFILTKLMGYRQMSEMSMFDYINGIITGKPLVLMNQDVIYEKNLMKSKIDVSDLLIQCRINGYFNLSDLQTIVLEPNGRMSFLPKSDKRPANPSDFGQTPQQEYLVANVIIDGHIMEENLRYAGKDENWLSKQMASQNIRDVREVLLAACDMQNNITFYPRTHKEMMKDLLS